MTTDVTPRWDIVIRPKRHWLDLRIAELWRYRDLIGLFVWRDFVSVYKQTILGPVWYLVQALLTASIFTVIFGKVARISTEGLNPFLFYMSGIIVWRYFADSLSKTSATFTRNAHIFGKVYFPRLSVPISIVLSNLISFALQFLQFTAFMIYFGLKGADFQPNACILFTPFLLLILAALGLGFGILASSLTVRYRDFQFLVAFGLQLFMFLTPVVYPSSIVPQQYRWFVLLNPIAPIIETFRYGWLGAGQFSIYGLTYSAVFAAILLLGGVALFNRVEQTFMDTV